MVQWETKVRRYQGVTSSKNCVRCPINTTPRIIPLQPMTGDKSDISEGEVFLGCRGICIGRQRGTLMEGEGRKRRL